MKFPLSANLFQVYGERNANISFPASAVMAHASFSLKYSYPSKKNHPSITNFPTRWLDDVH